MFDVEYTQKKQRPNGVKYTKSDIASDDLYGRIAASKETHPAAQALLVKYGYGQAKTETELAHKLASVVMNVGESALKDIAGIHPDKELILSFYSHPVPEIPVVEKKPAEENKAFDHDCGCSKHMNSDGSQSPRVGPPTDKTNTAELIASAATHDMDYSKYMKPALLISVSLLLVAVVWKKM